MSPASSSLITTATGVFDPDEPGIEGVYVYLDIDGDNRPSLGEPSARTAADGSYEINFPGPGTYTIREVVEPGFIQTFPSGGEHTVVFDGDTLDQNYNFGNLPSRDFGDAPAAYGTPNHGITQGLTLGTEIDRELAAQPTLDADGDDNNGPIGPGGNVIDDEDGAIVTSPLAPGGTATIDVSVNNTSGSPAYLQAWIDFNGDNSFTGPGEQLASDLRLDTGTHELSFDVPDTAVVGPTYARLRYSHERGLGPDGAADTGEVEDYLVNILGEAELANDDAFTVTRNSLANQLFVLANDFQTPNNQLEIVAASPAGSEGGAVQVAGDNQSIFYTPPGGFLGRETFDYTVEDAFGNTSTATVEVTVTFQTEDPIALDDTFAVPEGAQNRALNVLDNDIASTAGGLTIIGVTPGDSGGTISIVGGGQSLRYTPLPGFGGTEQFQYSVQDPAGNVSSATVTVNLVPSANNDDLVDFSFRLSDTVNNDPVTDVQVGDKVQLTVLVDDLRPNQFGDPRGVCLRVPRCPLQRRTGLHRRSRRRPLRTAVRGRPRQRLSTVRH